MHTAMRMNEMRRNNDPQRTNAGIKKVFKKVSIVSPHPRPSPCGEGSLQQVL